MNGASTLRWIRPTRLTVVALAGTLAGIACSAAFLLANYSSLPDLLPVRFGRSGGPNGWQFKTPSRGARWTLNFGRPMAVALMLLTLGIGVIGPTVILGLLLR